MCWYQFTKSHVSLPGWIRTHHTGLGKSLEATRPQGCYAGCWGTGIHISYSRAISSPKKKKIACFWSPCSRIGESMRHWSRVPHKGSSWGSATTVENMGTKLLSVGVVVRYHAPTEDQYTKRWLQGKISLKKINRRLNFRIYRVPWAFDRVLWPKKRIQVKLHIVCRRFNKSYWMGVKDGKWSKEKTNRLQKGVWHNKRFDRGWLYACV